MSVVASLSLLVASTNEKTLEGLRTQVGNFRKFPKISNPKYLSPKFVNPDPHLLEALDPDQHSFAVLDQDLHSEYGSGSRCKTSETYQSSQTFAVSAFKVSDGDGAVNAGSVHSRVR